GRMVFDDGYRAVLAVPRPDRGDRPGGVLTVQGAAGEAPDGRRQGRGRGFGVSVHPVGRLLRLRPPPRISARVEVSASRRRARRSIEWRAGLESDNSKEPAHTYAGTRAVGKPKVPLSFSS